MHTDNGPLLVRLRRVNTSTPWGFRMNGGSEQTQPLFIQKVTEGSVAVRSGILPGDAILVIGRQDTGHLTHEQAKMAIIREGNELDFVVQRCTNNPEVCHVTEPPRWNPRAAIATDPSMQSRSFKLVQQQLTTAATGE